MITIEKYKPADLAAVQGRAYEQDFGQLSGKNYAEAFATGPAFTVWNDGVPVGAGGVVPIWEHVGEAWLYLSDYLSSHPKTGYATMRKLFALILEQHDFHRVHAAICASMTSNRRLVEHLGFKAEVGTLKYWAGDEDYIMYAITNEGERICLQL